MTIIVGGIFDRNNILLMGDTQITEQGKPDKTIPGRLKIVIIGLHLSVGYAGYTDQAMDAIRKAKRLYDTQGTEAFLGCLQSASASIDSDFLVACHDGAPRLIKFFDGHRRIFLEGSVHIGSDDARNRYDVSLAQVRDRIEASMPMLMHPVTVTEEQIATSAFNDLFLRAPQLLPKVGGFPMTIHASPHGHYYQTMLASYKPGPFVVNGPADPDTPPPGGDSYSFHLLGSSFRGAGVAGAYSDEAKTGYLYLPIRDDDPLIRIGITENDLRTELNYLALEAGGVHENLI